MMNWSSLWHLRPTKQRWGVCLLALLLPVLMLQIRVQLPIAFGERPLLVLFMLPIIVCALLGGGGYAQAAAVFTERELAHVVGMAAVINSWNRLNAATRKAVPRRR